MVIIYYESFTPQTYDNQYPQSLAILSKPFYYVEFAENVALWIVHKKWKLICRM